MKLGGSVITNLLEDVDAFFERLYNFTGKLLCESFSMSSVLVVFLPAFFSKIPWYRDLQ